MQMKADKRGYNLKKSASARVYLCPFPLFGQARLKLRLTFIVR